ncbi:GNAT family N-acetyltransferase [Pseudonocardia sp. MH-G8]|uniref:GNAT family N-acetyltransferase n=1 Tax=Pseudonocardia sp. MH-G8 TaxID=1854588 RepID=UPI000B9FA48E|nr:GNAT family N-acetyltransferase [Pseudonocardia sp. MH-G8]OZM79684.1 GNAT family N-acetyltransferase [Pseudonocardia sp. MH-G8]
MSRQPQAEAQRSTGYAVRPARPHELTAAGELCVAGYRADGFLAHGGADHYEAVLLDAAGRAAEAAVLVAAEPDGRLLGTLTWCPPGSGLRELATRPEQGEFRMLAVHPAARRRGVARALVEHCLADARRLGLTELVLSSMPEMTAAHALYVRLGFRRATELDWSPVPSVHLWGFRRALA